MYAVIVTLDIRQDRLEEFRTAVLANAEASVRDEPGCLRFDVLRVDEAASQFVLYEIYRDRKAYLTGHRTAPHYYAWRDAVAGFLKEGGQEVTRCVPIEGRELAA